MSERGTDGPKTQKRLISGRLPLALGGTALKVARAVVEALSGTRGRCAALATVLDTAGSAPQTVGARLLLFADGTMVGTVGGGAIELQVLDACRQVLRDGRSRRIEAHLVRDLGMCCGGSMEVFVEHLQAQARLVIVGAGHVAQALAPVAAATGFRVTVLDDREELLQSPAFVDATCLAYDVDELDVGLPDLDQHDYVVIVTRDHSRDERALTHLLRRPHRYIGMIGSRRKVHAVVGRVLRREHGLGRTDIDVSRLRAPVGLALGGRTPQEIAISIVAEIVADRHGGNGRSMSIVGEAIDRVGDAEPERAGEHDEAPPDPRTKA